MTLKDFKTLLMLFIILFVSFGSFTVYRAIEVDPVLDAVYSEVNGTAGVDQ